MVNCSGAIGIGDNYPGVVFQGAIILVGCRPGANVYRKIVLGTVKIFFFYETMARSFNIS